LEAAEIPIPPARLEITHRDGPRELFMSFLRLNQCLRMLGEPDRLPFLVYDPDLSEMILKVMLDSKAGPAGGLDYPLAEDELTADEIEKILMWVQGHLMSFFARQFQMSAKQAANLEPITAALQSSLPGLRDLISKDLAAGRSA
jgi:hypothetical protein